MAHNPRKLRTIEVNGKLYDIRHCGRYNGGGWVYSEHLCNCFFGKDEHRKFRNTSELYAHLQDISEEV